MELAIDVKNLRKVYRLGKEKVVALDNINVQIPQGEVCCILGTSGSGKSTLLNMLAGLEKPTRGVVRVFGQDIAKYNEKKLTLFRQRYIGFVFQSYNLIGTFNALENVSMPLMFRGVSKRKRQKAAAKMLREVKLGSRMKHRPNQMSGGQQQRVGIARAFVTKPKLVFADEPTGNLDTKTTMEVMTLMVKFCRENHSTLVLVTHDRDIARYADRILTIVDGNIVEDRKNLSLYDSAAVNDPELSDGIPPSDLTQINGQPLPGSEDLSSIQPGIVAQDGVDPLSTGDLLPKIKWRDTPFPDSEDAGPPLEDSPANLPAEQHIPS